MTNLLKTGSDWLEAQRDAHCTTAVQYTHNPAVGESWTIAIDATIGSTDFEIAAEYGVEAWQSRDYLVLAAELLEEGGDPVEPRRGDQIQETAGGHTYTYEVMAPANDPPWRYSDPHRVTLRIHTKLVGET